MSEKLQKACNVRREWLFVAILGVAVMLAACGGEPTIDPLEIGDPERGREIHETGAGIIGGDTGRGCSACHSLDGSVGAPPQGPSFQGISERAGDRVPELSAVEYLRQSIVDPSAYLVEGFDDNMAKGFRFFFSEEDIDDLVAFMLTQ
jgi:mono/diheme cytochrome c family protein